MLEIEGIVRVQISRDYTPNPPVLAMEIIQHPDVVIVSVWILDAGPISHSYVERFIINVINIDEFGPMKGRGRAFNRQWVVVLGRHNQTGKNEIVSGQSVKRRRG
jgi:hypothetical protein